MFMDEMMMIESVGMLNQLIRDNLESFVINSRFSSAFAATYWVTVVQLVENKVFAIVVFMNAVFRAGIDDCQPVQTCFVACTKRIKK